MKQVAVLGGGPAGAFTAERLASAGLPVVLFDEKLAWEKPCGGGLTYKAYQRYPFLLDNAYPKRFVSETRLSADRAGPVRLPLREPLLIYSRMDLNRLLLERAGRAGARIEKARVLGMDYDGARWTLRTSGGALSADFCVLATGARNSLHHAGTRWRPQDTMTALGYYVPVRQEHIDIRFLPGLYGYIWVFPRCGHASVGICGKDVPARELRARLESFMERHSLSWKDAAFYSHLLPSLGPSAWGRNRLAGPGWLAVGDAAGLVDPITGEGLYYALRSADLAGRALLGGEPHSYRSQIARDFARDLELAAHIAQRFFFGRFLLGSITARFVQFAEHSARFREVVRDLFDGTQSYGGLKRRLLDGLRPTLAEVLRGAILPKAGFDRLRAAR